MAYKPHNGPSVKGMIAIVVSPLLLGLAACQTYNSDDDISARIVESSATSRAELQRAVNDAVGSEVTLADDALTMGSSLTIEQKQPATMQNPRPQGRVLDMPIQFRLVRNRGHCFLIDQRDGTRLLLESTRCVAE